MLRGLYDWTLSLAARKSAEWWLAFIAFVESSIFLVPADVLYLPMTLARPERAYRYALVATVASVLGGIAGWFIGHYAYEAIAVPVLQFYGKYDEFEALRTSSGIGFIILMLITSGAAHLPPIKVVTILSGVIGVSLPLFIGLAIVARGGRFLLLAWLLRRYGEQIRDFIEKRSLRWIGISFLLLAAYVAYESAESLWAHEAPQRSIPGIMLALASLIVMPIMAVMFNSMPVVQSPTNTAPAASIGIASTAAATRKRSYRNSSSAKTSATAAANTTIRP